ncbi:MAG: phosphomannomutase, partial [Boseongicola sp.]|nr:phosphomannomutase [Boseongicola sp.]
VGAGAKGSVATCNALKRYAARYLDFFPRGALQGRRIGVWQHSSAAREVLPEILSALGAEVVLLAPSDDFIAVDTEAVSGAVRDRLAEWATTHGLDAIVSTDGDADRPLVADETGIVVPGDVLGPMTARAMGARNLVTTVSANTMVEAMDHFESVSRCRIGSPYVIEMMEEKIASGVENVLGYEPNGGVLLGFQVQDGGRSLAPLMTRDAVLPIVAVLVAASGDKVSALVSALPQRRTATDRLEHVPIEISAAIVADVLGGQSDLFPTYLGAIRVIDTTEGARLTMESGLIVTIRPSGNAPELRCYVEAETAEVAAEVLSDIMARLAARVANCRK